MIHATACVSVEPVHGLWNMHGGLTANVEHTATRYEYSRRIMKIYMDVVTYAHYACVVDCADAMADAWDDTAGCAQPICLHENLLK